ncbi:BRCT domain-containing protein [Sedimenticola selenatireducens]|uniref:BRCT domain-containing protein n=1 Tax=Sedimenticola selenatireducens TaxID=191960 RepID=A0A558E0M8_9GAMM|nr:BRCT domain-containing protein [Sedimenticola selenatireducens]TVO75233.1 hypothetical protein FHP88_09500 [Sedimenticola selenatireducens]TVT66914.1 MAG: hypothetical protein FHK78_00860 [Sedimenticola selenatireducens]
MVDDHGQPLNRRYNYTQNFRKALQDLFGICEGILADKHITTGEAIFLDTWLRNNRILERDPDYRDLFELTSDILADGIVTADELDDLQGLIETFLEYRSDSDFANEKEAMQRLLGLLKGVSADQELNEVEILVLAGWLDQAEPWTNNPIGAGVRAGVGRILADGVITSEEKDILLQLLYETTGFAPDMGISDGLTIGVFNDKIDHIEFIDRSFCFTGRFTYGARSECQKATLNQGASIHKTVTKKTNYLVIGELSSRDWTNSSYGTKIQKAIGYRDGGVPIVILHERVWINSLC